MSVLLAVLEWLGWWCAASFAVGAILGTLGFIRNTIRERPR